MIQLQVLQKIGILAVSVLLGYAYYFFISEEKKQLKWQNGNMLVSQLINFIICLWIGKLLTHMGLFLHDPMAVLAYPSDANAFYIATGLMFVYTAWLTVRKKWQAMNFVRAFVPTFLAASFVFECIQLWTKQHMNWQYAALLLLLILAHVLLYNRIAGNLLSLALLTCWGIGELVLMTMNPYVTIFGFVISGWYFTVVAILAVLACIRQIRNAPQSR